MITAEDILYEDNHVIVVNKRAGELVQPDLSTSEAMEGNLKEYIKIKYAKPGAVFLGVVHRIDRPVSGAVLFARTSKALVRLNEQLRDRGFSKIYWAVIENTPPKPEGELVHYILRNGKTNRSSAHDKPVKDGQEAIMRYKLIASSDNYKLLEVELLTGRHHQIRAQLAKIGCPIKGDLKYGAARSNRDGSISLHSHSLEFEHPVTKERVKVIAPTPEDSLWNYFDSVTK